MHTRHGGRWMFAALVGWLVLSTLVVSAQPRYTLVDLGTFEPRATNIHGDLVGQQDANAIICLAGQPCLDLGPATANDINDARQVVGLNSVGGFIWHPDTGVQLLPEEFEGETLTEPFSINTSGVIVGRSWDLFREHPLPMVIKPPYEVVTITGLGFGIPGVAWAINAAGVIAGTTSVDIDRQAMRCASPDGSCAALGVLTHDGFGDSFGFGINTAGTIVGMTDFTPEDEPDGFIPVGFRWTASTGMQPLISPSDVFVVAAHAINDQGTIVGRASSEARGQDALLWETDGQVHHLTDLVMDAEGWQLIEAVAIHNDGRILATGFHEGQFKGVVLHPVEEGIFDPPVADATVKPTRGTAPLKVQFMSRSSGAIDTFLWEFGDGKRSRKAKTSHTYSKPGTYTATLTVEGPGGRDTWSTTIEVTAKAPKKPKPQPVARR